MAVTLSWEGREKDETWILADGDVSLDVKVTPPLPIGSSQWVTVTIRQRLRVPIDIVSEESPSDSFSIPIPRGLGPLPTRLDVRVETD